MFTDSDIRKNGPRGASTFNYSRIDGVRDDAGEVKVPHKAEFQQASTETFTLAHVNGSLKWTK